MSGATDDLSSYIEPLVVASIEGIEVAEPLKPLIRSFSGRVMFFGLLSDFLRGNLILCAP
jgi:hypothetical protein